MLNAEREPTERISERYPCSPLFKKTKKQTLSTNNMIKLKRDEEDKNKIDHTNQGLLCYCILKKQCFKQAVLFMNRAGIHAVSIGKKIPDSTSCSTSPRLFPGSVT